MSGNSLISLKFFARCGRGTPDFVSQNRCWGSPEKILPVRHEITGPVFVIGICLVMSSLCILMCEELHTWPRTFP
jgi:hypothetical protein